MACRRLRATCAPPFSSPRAAQRAIGIPWRFPPQPTPPAPTRLAGAQNAQNMAPVCLAPKAGENRAERRLRAVIWPLAGPLSSPVWPIGWSPVLYIYTSPSLGRISASAAMKAQHVFENEPEVDRLRVV